jgi:serine/threonine protein kinase
MDPSPSSVLFFSCSIINNFCCHSYRGENHYGAIGGDNHYSDITILSNDDPLFKFLISFSAIELGKELGRGAFGVVYQARLNGETIACKMVSAKQMNPQEFVQEARTMSAIPSHQNVVRLIGFCRDENVCILSGT